MMDHYLAKLALEVYLDDYPFAVNVALFSDVGSLHFRFEAHAEVPNSPLAGYF